MSEPDLTAENASLEALRAGYTKYQNAKAALLASIDTERAAGRLLMTDESYNRLYSNVASIELNFIGLYDAKASLMTYLKRQLTGSRPRSETSNHIVGVGDPGTGKTSLMQVVASMMVRLGLIESPTLQSYTSLGKTLENSLTGGETDRIAGTSLPADVPEALYSRLSAPSLFALRAASGDKTSPQPEPQVYDPGKFESPFEGGRVAQFLRGVFRTLGSSMIIDEAYGLSNARFRDIVDQLVALITQLKTQWSTVLLGYQEDMDEFFATGNIGLRRRYDITISFNSYSASELVAILILNTIRADNIVFAATEEQVLTVAAEPDPDDASVKDAVTSVMNDVYKKMGPYAMIHRSSQNRFGSDNAGAVEKLFGALGTAAITKFLGAPTLLLVTPDDVAGQMENKVQFGRFTAEVRAERARALAARNQGGGGGDDSSGR